VRLALAGAVGAVKAAASGSTTPSAPTLNTVTDRFDGGFDAAWTPSSNGGAAYTSWQYQVNSTGSAYTLTNVTDPTSDFTGSGSNGVFYNQLITIRVRGVNVNGAGAWSNTISVEIYAE